MGFPENPSSWYGADTVPWCLKEFPWFEWDCLHKLLRPSDIRSCQIRDWRLSVPQMEGGTTLNHTVDTVPWCSWRSFRRGYSQIPGSHDAERRPRLSPHRFCSFFFPRNTSGACCFCSAQISDRFAYNFCSRVRRLYIYFIYIYIYNTMYTIQFLYNIYWWINLVNQSRWNKGSIWLMVIGYNYYFQKIISWKSMRREKI